VPCAQECTGVRAGEGAAARRAVHGEECKYIIYSILHIIYYFIRKTHGMQGGGGGDGGVSFQLSGLEGVCPVCRSLRRIGRGIFACVPCRRARACRGVLQWLVKHQPWFVRPDCVCARVCACPAGACARCWCLGLRSRSVEPHG